MTNDGYDTYGGDEVELWLNDRRDDISFALDSKGVEHETHLTSDGGDGWHMVITAGQKVDGDAMREYTLTYSSAEVRWLYQAYAEDGDRVGPHDINLDPNIPPFDVAAHIAANVTAD